MPKPLANPLGLAGDDRRTWHLSWLKALDGGTAVQHPERAAAGDDDVLWMPDGSGGYRAVGEPRGTRSDFDREPTWPSYLPENPAAVEPAEIFEVGNPENRRLKQEYIRKYGSWPKTADGTDYVVSHIKAIADGGSNTLDNIEPMDPKEHVAKHMRDGDYSRVAKRPGIARAFGGRVEPPLHAPKPRRGPTVRGFGLLGVLPNILGILNGRIRTDNFVDFTSDMLGLPSLEDARRQDEELRRLNEEYRRRYFPNSKPGDLVA